MAGAGSIFKRIFGGAVKEAGEEAAERAGREAAERVGREAAERAAREAAEKTARETAERTARETAEKVARGKSWSGSTYVARGHDALVARAAMAKAAGHPLASAAYSSMAGTMRSTRMAAGIATTGTIAFLLGDAATGQALSRGLGNATLAAADVVKEISPELAAKLREAAPAIAKAGVQLLEMPYNSAKAYISQVAGLDPNDPMTGAATRALLGSPVSALLESQGYNVSAESLVDIYEEAEKHENPGAYIAERLKNDFGVPAEVTAGLHGNASDAVRAGAEVARDAAGNAIDSAGNALDAASLANFAKDPEKAWEKMQEFAANNPALKRTMEFANQNPLLKWGMMAGFGLGALGGGSPASRLASGIRGALIFGLMADLIGFFWGKPSMIINGIGQMMSKSNAAPATASPAPSPSPAPAVTPAPNAAEPATAAAQPAIKSNFTAQANPPAAPELSANQQAFRGAGQPAAPTAPAAPVQNDYNRGHLVYAPSTM